MGELVHRQDGYPGLSVVGSAEGLSAIAAACYRWALKHGRVETADTAALTADLGAGPAEIGTALDRLIGLHLLYPAAGAPETLVPASPETAVAQSVTPIEREIESLERHAEQLKSEVLSLNLAYFESQQARNRRQAVDVVSGMEQARSLLADAARACRSEVFSAHPGVLTPQAVASALPQDLRLLGRGVRMRALYQHPVRVNTTMREFLIQLGGAGGAIRTCEEISERIVIFDREVAFIPHLAGGSGAVVVRDQSIVEFLYRSLEQTWFAAVPYEADDATALGYGGAGDEIKRAIIRMMAAGAKDELIARRLSVSLRTCRRHIAEIMEGLHARSRFQAGVLASQSGLVEDTAEGESGTRAADRPLTALGLSTAS